MSEAFLYNHEIEAGVTYDKIFTWKAGEPLVLVDLTGCTAVAQFRTDAGALVLEMSTANAKLVLGGALGTIRFKLTAAEATALPWAKVQYDLLITFADATTVKRKMYGEASVTRGVTR